MMQTKNRTKKAFRSALLMIAFLGVALLPLVMSPLQHAGAEVAQPGHQLRGKVVSIQDMNVQGSSAVPVDPAHIPTLPPGAYVKLKMHLINMSTNTSESYYAVTIPDNGNISINTFAVGDDPGNTALWTDAPIYSYTYAHETDGSGQLMHPGANERFVEFYMRTQNNTPATTQSFVIAAVETYLFDGGNPVLDTHTDGSVFEGGTLSYTTGALTASTTSADTLHVDSGDKAITLNFAFTNSTTFAANVNEVRHYTNEDHWATEVGADWSIDVLGDCGASWTSGDHDDPDYLYTRSTSDCVLQPGQAINTTLKTHTRNNMNGSSAWTTDRDTTITLKTSWKAASSSSSMTAMNNGDLTFHLRILEIESVEVTSPANATSFTIGQVITVKVTVKNYSLNSVCRVDSNGDGVCDTGSTLHGDRKIIPSIEFKEGPTNLVSIVTPIYTEQEHLAVEHATSSAGQATEITFTVTIGQTTSSNAILTAKATGVESNSLSDKSLSSLTVKKHPEMTILGDESHRPIPAAFAVGVQYPSIGLYASHSTNSSEFSDPSNSNFSYVLMDSACTGSSASCQSHEKFAVPKVSLSDGLYYFTSSAVNLPVGTYYAGIHISGVDNNNVAYNTYSALSSPAIEVRTDIDPPGLSVVSMTSNNALFNASTNRVAKTADTVTLTIVADEDIQTPAVTIATQSCSVVQGVDASHWTATHVMAAGDLSDGADITFEISNIRDIAGTAASNVTSLVGGAVNTKLKFHKDKPTVVLGPATTAQEPTTSSPFNFTMTFTENVTGFDTSKVTLTGGTKGSATTAAQLITIPITPTVTNGPTTIVMTVGADAITDMAGNGIAAQSAFTIYVDLTAADDSEPYLISVSAEPADGQTAKSAYKSGDRLTLTFTFEDDNNIEFVNGVSSVTVGFASTSNSSCIISSLTGNTKTATCTYTVGSNENFDADTPRRVNSLTGIQDTAEPNGNAFDNDDILENGDHYTNAIVMVDQNALVLDNTKPTVATFIVDGNSTPTPSTTHKTIPIVVGFSEPITGFTATDIAVSSSGLTFTKSSVSQVAETNNWTLTITLSGTVPAAQSATVSFSIALDGLADSAGNTNALVSKSFDFTVSVPTVTVETPAGGIPPYSSTLTGHVTDDGGGTISAKGFLWCNTNSACLTSTTKTVANGGDNDDFTLSTITGLTDGTYYFRVYATNQSGTTYTPPSGEPPISFAVTAVVTPPSVTTSAAISVTSTGVTLSGVINNTNGQPAHDAGFRLHTSYSFCTADTNHSGGGYYSSIGGPTWGAGNIYANVSGLTPNTTYAYYAVADNSDSGGGAGYGACVSFTTTAAIVIPTVTTSAVSNRLSTSVTLNGTITSLGNASSASQAGFKRYSSLSACSSDTGHTSGSSFSANGSSWTTTFSTSLTGLSASTTYAVIAYASNTAGFGWGSCLEFSTTSAATAAPTITSMADKICYVTKTLSLTPTTSGGATFAWTNPTKPTGATLTFSTTSAANTSVTPNTVGSYVLHLAVTNDVGTATDDINLTVRRMGDISGSGALGKVGTADFALLMSNWGSNFRNPLADLDGDGAVGRLDFAIIMFWWGK